MPNPNPDMSGLKPIKKGEVRNPNGRPKGKVSLERALKLIMERPADYIDPVTGEAVSGHYLDKHLAELIELSKIDVGDDPKKLNVKLQAIKELNDRYAGKAKQVIELSEPEQIRHDLSLLNDAELAEYINLENRIAELLTKCAITSESGPEDSSRT